MNEKIKELWEESAVTLFPDPGSFTAGEYDYQIENFAEAIVKECANRAAWAQDTKAEDIGEEVLKHFGIEE